MPYSGYRTRLRTVLLAAALIFISAVFSVSREAFADHTRPQAGTASEAAAELPEEWFDDALFIGDSITGSLSTYTLLNGGLGNAIIVHSNGLGCHHIVRDDRKIPILGSLMTIEDAVSASGCGKLFLMLAMNDIGTEPIETLQADWETVLDRILEKNPSVTVYVQSGTPVLYNAGYFTRENMEAYNAMLQTVCQSRDCVYADVTRGMKDENGFMKKELHLDMFHISSEGAALWVNNLHDPGSYTPPLSPEKEKTP